MHLHGTVNGDCRLLVEFFCFVLIYYAVPYIVLFCFLRCCRFIFSLVLVLRLCWFIAIITKLTVLLVELLLLCKCFLEFFLL